MREAGAWEVVGTCFYFKKAAKLTAGSLTIPWNGINHVGIRADGDIFLKIGVWQNVSILQVERC